jgi:hypothetical protein
MHCRFLPAFGVFSGSAKTPPSSEDARPVPYAMASHRIGELRSAGCTSEQTASADACVSDSPSGVPPDRNGIWTLLYHDRARNRPAAIHCAYNRRDSRVFRHAYSAACRRWFQRTGRKQN